MRKHYGTPAEFRKTKRREARAAYDAVHTLLVGCAFTPAGRHITAALEEIRQARVKLQVKNFKKMI